MLLFFNNIYKHLIRIRKFPWKVSVSQKHRGSKVTANGRPATAG